MAECAFFREGWRSAGRTLGMGPPLSRTRDRVVTRVVPGRDLPPRHGDRPRHSEPVELNPPGQYADDRNLQARQRLWQGQVPCFDIAGWVLDLAGLTPGQRSSMLAAVTASTCGPCVSGG